MKVVIDTNCILVALSRMSKFNWLIQKFINKTFDLFFTTEILNEYEEVISRYFSLETAEPFYELLISSHNTVPVNVSFKFDRTRS